jgi:hypothetical protein
LSSLNDQPPALANLRASFCPATYAIELPPRKRYLTQDNISMDLPKILNLNLTFSNITLALACLITG